MKKKKMTVLSLCLCAVCIALHIILEVFCTVRIGNDLKISFATLPFVIVALLCGPLEGFVTGLIGTFLSQLITFGITITTPFWIIPGALQGLAAGLIFVAFKRKTKLVPIGVTVFGAGLVLVIFNLIASYFDGVVFFKYWTIEVLIGLIPIRLAVWVGISIVYTIVGFPITKALLKSCPGGFRQQKKLAASEPAAAQAE